MWKDLASRHSPELCGSSRKAAAEALTGESAGRELSRERNVVGSADAVGTGGRQHHVIRKWRRIKWTPRGRRPRARMDASWTGTGRSWCWPRIGIGVRQGKPKGVTPA